MAANIFSLSSGKRPASESGVALTMIMNRISVLLAVGIGRRREMRASDHTTKEQMRNRQLADLVETLIIPTNPRNSLRYPQNLGNSLGMQNPGKPLGIRET